MPIEAYAIADGCRWDVSLEFGQTVRARFTNPASHSLRLERIVFSGFAFPGKGEDLQVYSDGWNTVSAVGTHRYGECDFLGNPKYLQYFLAEPKARQADSPNHFCAENVLVLRNASAGESLLLGFVTTGDFFNRIEVKIGTEGIQRLEAHVLGDGIEVASGENVVSEELLVLHGCVGYVLLEEYASVWGRRMGARLANPIPVGWCSWYSYFANLTEGDVLENLEFFRQHREEYPIEYFQIDDGYQPALGDWFLPSPRFPHGILPVLRRIAESGFKPGIWLAPFRIEVTSRLWQEHPEYMVRTPEGELFVQDQWREGHGTGLLDVTRPEAQEWLRATFRQFREAGCRYVKLDFMAHLCASSNAVFHDRNATRCQIYRRGLQTIRDGLGDDVFLLAGTALPGPSIGIVDATRVSTDITPYWQRGNHIYSEAPAVVNVVRNLISRHYMHHRLWTNDPDVLIVRKDNNQLTEDEVKLWTSVLYMLGGSFFLTDRMGTLPPERLALARMLLDEPDAFEEMRPVDFFEREIPCIWLGYRRRTRQPVLGFFNLQDEQQVIRFPQGKLPCRWCSR